MMSCYGDLSLLLAYYYYPYHVCDSCGADFSEGAMRGDSSADLTWHAGVAGRVPSSFLCGHRVCEARRGGQEARSVHACFATGSSGSSGDSHAQVGQHCLTHQVCAAVVSFKGLFVKSTFCKLRRQHNLHAHLTTLSALS